MTQRDSVCVCVSDCVMVCVFASHRCFFSFIRKNRLKVQNMTKRKKENQYSSAQQDCIYEQLHSKQLCNFLHQTENLFVDITVSIISCIVLKY